MAEYASTSPILPPAGKGKGFVLRIYRLRVLGLGAGFFCVASVFRDLPVSHALWALLVFHGFIWPHLACRYALRSARPFQNEQRNLLIDSAFGGVWAVAMQFNALPTALILTMLSMDNIAAGGKVLFLRGLVAHLAGAALCALLLGLHLQPQTNMRTLLICLPFLVIYPLALGNTTYAMSQRLAQRSSELEALSRIDGLTGLLNRRFWESRLAQIFARCQSERREACLVLLDLDHFKRVNDTQGHAAGDAALEVFSRMLERTLRKTDVIGRYGGEEFGVILIDTSLAEASAIVERLIAAVRASAADRNSLCPCTVSVGLCAFRPPLPTHHRWLLEVDRALYRAKGEGRNRIVVAEAAEAA